MHKKEGINPNDDLMEFKMPSEQEALEVIFPRLLETKKIYSDIKTMSHAERQKKYGNTFAEVFRDTEYIESRYKDPEWEDAGKWTEQKFWEWVSGVLHDYGARDIYRKENPAKDE